MGTIKNKTMKNSNGIFSKIINEVHIDFAHMNPALKGNLYTLMGFIAFILIFFYAVYLNKRSKRKEEESTELSFLSDMLSRDFELIESNSRNREVDPRYKISAVNLQSLENVI
jgi:hypothetical protein